MADWPYDGDIRSQSALAFALGKGHLHPIGVDLDILGDHLDHLVLHRVEHAGRYIDPIVDEHQLQPILGNLAAGRFTALK
jgi:hypothetical protein